MTTAPMASRRGQRRSIINAYRGAALLLLNTLVAFVVLNLLLWVVFVVRDARLPDASAGPELKYGQAALASVYPGLSTEERRALNKETWSRPWIRDDQLMFRERPFAGRYVNVHAAGFRSGKNQGPWPPVATNLNVFVFGGSTTFGYGLPDDQTVPSVLQELLLAQSGRPVRVYNFGVGYYYSTLERLKFEQLLVRQHKPAIAIFIDGINDCGWALDDKPVGNDAFQLGFGAAAQESALQRWVQKLPIMRAVNSVARRRAVRNAAPPVYIDPATDPAPMERLQKSLTRYLSNKRLIEGGGREFGVVPVFVWQPAPGHGYDLKHHLFIADPPWFQVQDQFYRLMDQHRTNQLGPNFFWCGDLQREAKTCLYVDNVHYTAEFSRQFAQSIAVQINKYPPARDLLSK